MRAAAASAAGVPTSAELREAVDAIRAEKLPETTDGREKYFASNLATAEQLGMQSESPIEHFATVTLIHFSARFPDKILPAATCLYRAMRVYPRPVDLMVVLEQSFPPVVFKAVMEMMKLEVSPSPSPSATPKSSAASDSASATSSRKSTRRSRKESGTRTSSGKSSPVGTGPPSETSSSYEWDKVTEPDSSATPPLVPQGPTVA